MGTAAARVWLDGQPVGADVKIPFNGTRRLAVLLAGSLGEQATVEIGPAESVILVDVIPVTTHDPFPVQYYEFRAEGK